VNNNIFQSFIPSSKNSVLMKKVVLIFAALFLLYADGTFAQTNTTTPRKWGLEVELAQPFVPNVGILRLQATRTLTATDSRMKGDLLVGGYFRPNVKHDIVEKINEYMLMLGYRQFFWKGLHAEAKTNIGYAWGTNNRFDGKDYNNFSWFWEANAGYKFDFLQRPNSNLYIAVQGGVISSITSNIGPRGGESDFFPQANLMLGINF
jgi:hypothetical protein